MAMYDPTTDGNPKIARKLAIEVTSSQRTGAVSQRRQGLPATASDGAVAPIRVNFAQSMEPSELHDSPVQLAGKISEGLTTAACPSEIYLG